MPTGYTARLYEGEQDFKDFVRNAARGMMPFVHLREAPADAPLTYRPDGREKALEDLKRYMCKHSEWRHMDEAERYRLWSEYVERTEREAAALDHSEYYARRDRFDTMIAKVESIVVPAELESFKKFMLQQLGTEFQYGREPYTPEPLSYPAWCESQDRYYSRREEMAREDYQREVDNYHYTRTYVDLLAQTYGFEVEGR